MKEFQLLRYLKKYRFLIALIMLAGCLFVYRYAQSHQTYTAAVTLEYVNETASEGLTPAGTRIDTSEIYSASVVTAAIQDLGISSSVEYIRSGIQVTPIIPEDEETRKELYKEQKSSTTIVKEQKVYPNDPCPCGSGKKYKKCCGRK